MYNIYVNIQIV